MDLNSSLVGLGDGTLPESFDGLKSQLPLDWIHSCLSNNGIATVRERKLPVDQVVWLVIGMALYRDRSIPEIVDRLDLVLPGADGRKRTVAEGAITPARDKVGAEPLRDLFQATSNHWALESAQRHAWRGLKVLGIDGTMLRVPDSTENRETFELQGGSSYPMIRLAALMALRSRLIVDCSFAGCRTSEPMLAKKLLPSIPDASVTVLDRYYHCYWLWNAIQSKEKNRHWIVRARDDFRVWKVIEKLGPGDELAEIRIRDQYRYDHPEVPETIRVRAIRFRKNGFKTRIILTSLLDPILYPARELAELYHERWELEIGFNEIKTRVLERREAIRSRSPERVKQEVWGLLIAYNVVRREMEAVANKLGVPPSRISFTMALRLVRELLLWAEVASPAKWPKMYEEMRIDLCRFVLPSRRRRSYPRHVKRRQRKYPGNVGHPA